MATLDEAREAKSQISALRTKFNNFAGVGLSGTPQTGYSVEVRLRVEPSAAERANLPSHITTKSNAVVPVNYQIIGDVSAYVP